MELVQTEIIKRHGFLADNDLARLIECGQRLTQVLVKCGGVRFVCAVQDAAQIISAIEEAGDYVRDVRIVAPQLERWKARAAGAPALPVAAGDPMIGNAPHPPTPGLTDGRYLVGSEVRQ